MVTSLRRATGWSLAAFLDADARHGILRFLEENYELLHYLGNDAVVAEILDHVSRQEGVA